MRYDLEAMRREREQIEGRIRELKALRRESMQPNWTAKEMGEFWELKVQATIFCTARASLRKKSHLSKDHVRYNYFVEKAAALLRKYELEELCMAA